jgi:CRP-like cAMP-binding protein
MSVMQSACTARSWHEQLLGAAGAGIRDEFFSKGEEVYTYGRSDSAVHLVRSGRVKTSMLSSSGKQCLLAIHTSGDLFGEAGLLAPERSEQAVTMTDAVVRRVPRDLFMEVLASCGMLEEFVRYLVKRVADQQQIITQLVTVDSEQRLAATLLRLSQKLGRRETGRVRIEQRITQEELSVMVGTTRSRVGYFLKQFRADGLIRTLPESFIEVDEERLTQYVKLRV